MTQVLVRGIGVEVLRTSPARRATRQTPARLAAEMVGQYWIREGKHALGVQVILPVAFGPAGLREPVVDLIAARAARPLEHAVDDSPAPLVLVETKRLKIVQRARGLRDRKAERVLHVSSQRIRRSRFISVGVPEECDEIARRRKPECRNDRIFRRIGEFVDVTLLERRPGGEQADGLVVHVLPAARRHFGRLVIETCAHRQGCFRLVPRGGRIRTARTARSWHRRS